MQTFSGRSITNLEFAIRIFFRVAEKITLQSVIYFSVVVVTEVAELTMLPLPPVGYITSIAPLLCRASKAARCKFGLE